MSTVCFGDICRQTRETLRPGERTDLRYIGLESIESNTGQFAQGEMSKTPESPQANSFRFGPKHLLYGKLRPYLNKVALPDFEGKCSTEIIPLLPSNEVDRNYLAFFLRSRQIVDLISARTSGSRMPRADMEFVFSLPIHLPCLPEQRRIADLLFRAEGIVRLRREAEKKTAELIPTLFLNVFGDPMTNPKGWRIEPIAAFVKKFQSGKNIAAAATAENNASYRVLKVSAVTSGTFQPEESKPLPNNYVPPPEHFVKVGDLLFSRANTVELVGATAYIINNCDGLVLPDKLWRFVWNDESNPNPFFVWALFQTQAVRQRLGKLATGTSGSMKNISQKKLMSMLVPLPPARLQWEFADMVGKCLSIKQQQSAAATKAQAVFDSLLARTFAVPQ